MPRRIRLLGVSLAILVAVFAVTNGRLSGQTGAPAREWRTWGGELANTKYSPLDQINKDNFNKLEVAWRFKTDALGPRPEFNYETTPLMANGVVYATAGTRRAVVALDAATGELLWVHREDEGARGEAAPRKLSGRGLAYWSDAREARVIYVTLGYRLVALDAKTGIPVPGFGKSGIVDLKLDDDQDMDLVTGEVGLHAAPTVAKDMIIVGAAHLPGGVPKSRRNEKASGQRLFAGCRAWHTGRLRRLEQCWAHRLPWRSAPSPSSLPPAAAPSFPGSEHCRSRATGRSICPTTS